MRRRDTRVRKGSRLVRCDDTTLELLDRLRQVSRLKTSFNRQIAELAIREAARLGLLQGVGKPTLSQRPPDASPAPARPSPLPASRSAAGAPALPRAAASR
jgi:hypothetical protein